MSTGRTVDLTFTFVIKREDDEDWPWYVALRSIEPRGTENCAVCSKAGNLCKEEICDACGAEESMDCGGPDEWLKSAGIKIEKEGTLVVNAYIEWWHTNGQDGDDWDDKIHVNWSRWEQIVTDQPDDYYVAEAVGWIDSVEGLSDADRSKGREIFAVLLAHHDVHLHGGRVPFDECLRRARTEFTPEDDPVQKLELRNKALEKLNALPAFGETVLAVPMDNQNNRGEQ